MSELKKEVEYFLLKREIAIRKARTNFWSFCQFMYPEYYTQDKKYLKEMCNVLDDFHNDRIKEKILIINLPPRHFKTFTARMFVLWLFGQNNKLKIMTGSYNEILSSLFSQQTRDKISEKKLQLNQDDYKDIFPDIKIKLGDASKGFWALDGSEEKNYLATSPNGTATGIGANYIIIDDIIKNLKDAYNEKTLDDHWLWYNNTMIQRLEKPRKQIFIMTRWSTQDLCGRILETKKDKCKLITFKAVQDDGTMLCDDILNKEDFEELKEDMAFDIVSANYQQEPIDVVGRLYTDLKEYETLPEEYQIKSWCDVADEGDDYLVNVVYAEKDRYAYILDILFTKEKQEITETKHAEMTTRNEVNYAWFESNAGGKTYARIVEMKARKLGNIKTKFQWKPTTTNKKARILANSSVVENRIFFPKNWKTRFPEFAKNITTFQREGKNAHDDGPDVLTMIAESLGKQNATVLDKRALGL